MSELKTYKLNCASCNSNLEVPSDIDKFNCSYCGTQLMIERRGGIIVLREVVSAINKVQTGTDKTAAELALQRLPSELSIVQKQLEEQNEYWQKYISEQLKPLEKKIENERFGGLGCGCGTFIVLYGIVYIIGRNFDVKDSILGIFLLVLLLITPILVGFWVHKLGKKKIAQLNKDKNELLIRLNSERNFKLNKLNTKIKNLKDAIQRNREIVNSM